MVTFVHFFMDSRITCVTRPQSTECFLSGGVPARTRSAFLALTLIDVEEGLAELVGEKGLREVPEELFYHIRHVIRRLVLVADILREVLVHLT